MSYDLTLERKPTYLHATATGTRSEENARRFLVDAYVASVEHKCGSLLLEMNLSGPPLSLASVYSVIAERSPDGANLQRIAYVDQQSDDSAEFAELVAFNRGVNVRLFQRLSDAERWLSSPPTAAERSAATGSFESRSSSG
jgi:hypothetical protein